MKWNTLTDTFGKLQFCNDNLSNWSEKKNEKNKKLLCETYCLNFWDCGLKA